MWTELQVKALQRLGAPLVVGGALLLPPPPLSLASVAAVEAVAPALLWWLAALVAAEAHFPLALQHLGALAVAAAAMLPSPLPPSLASVAAAEVAVLTAAPALPG